MKLELQEPYKSDFKAAYCYKNKEPRRVVSLIYKNGGRTSTSYARYLMSCELGRYLKEDEHVDHIDEDKLNDSIENLQVLSPKDNHGKSHKKHFAILLCPVCLEKFKIEWRNTCFQKVDKFYTTCSRSCGGKASHMDNSKLEDKFELIEHVWE